MQTLRSTILDELTHLEQWVVWRYVYKPDKDKYDKVPINPRNGEYAKANDSSTWGSYEQALAALDDYDGLGFFISEDDPYCGVDFDNCLNPDTGELAQWSLDFMGLLDSYMEISPSETGVHILIRGSKPGTRCKHWINKETREAVEIYDHSRFITVTGNVLRREGIEERQQELETLYYQLFPAVEDSTPRDHDLHSGGGVFPGTDQQLITKARNNYKTGALFRKLFDRGDWSGYSSQSEADLALCGNLAFWSVKDASRIFRIFMGSALASTIDRHSNPDDYLERTIQEAIGNCKIVYNPKEYKRQKKSEVEDALNDCMDYLLSQSWRGRSGPTDRDVYKALINTGFKSGKFREDGVSVAISTRTVVLEAGIGQLKTGRKSLQRLQNKGLIERLEGGDNKGKSAVYLIKLTQKNPTYNCVNKGGVVSSQKMRNPAPLSFIYSTIGKRNAHILDYVHSLGRTVTLDEIAGKLVARKNNLQRRNIPLLLEEGLLLETEEGYSTPGDIEARLEHFLEESGCNQAEQIQRDKYARERKAWYSKQDADPEPELRGAAAVQEMITRPNANEPRLVLEEESPTCVNPELEVIEGSGHGEDCRCIECHPLDCECDGCLYPEPSYVNTEKYDHIAKAQNQSIGVAA